MMRAARDKFDPAAQDSGFILIAVLWLLATLAGLAAIYAVYLQQTAFTEPLYLESAQADALAEGAVELAVYRVSSGMKRPSIDSFEFAANRAAVRVTSRAENGFIDLNTAPEPVFTGLFTTLGAGPSLAQRLARRIVDRRGASGGTPFQHVYEVASLLKDQPQLLQRAMQSFTVYNGQPAINLLAAPADVLAALPGMTPDRLYALAEMRDKAPQDVLMARLGPAASMATVVPGDSVRVRMQIDFDRGRHSFAYEAVVLLLPRGDSEPYRVLSWHADTGLDPDLERREIQ